MNEPLLNERAVQYLDYQGRKYLDRGQEITFNPEALLELTAAWTQLQEAKLLIAALVHGIGGQVIIPQSVLVEAQGFAVFTDPVTGDVEIVAQEGRA